jgi:hypothetical protein
VQDNQEGLQLNGLNHILAYTNVNLLGENMNIKITEILLLSSRETGLVVSIDKTAVDKAFKSFSISVKYKYLLHNNSISLQFQCILLPNYPEYAQLFP